MYHLCYKLSVSIWLQKKFKSLDPSNFTWAIKCKLSNIKEVPFDFDNQQDVTKVLQVVLNEIKGVPLAASHLLSNTQF